MTKPIKTELGNISDPIKKLIEQLKKHSPRSAQPLPTFDCAVCEDRGYTFEMQGGYSCVKDCICKLKNLRRKRVSVIPPKFQNASLETLTADVRRHSMQPDIVEKMKKFPDRNYYFGGKFGTGKTLLLWTLYRAAVERDVQRVVVCTLTELLNDFKQFIQSSQSGTEKKYPRLSAEDLRQSHTRFSIFLDDVDKARPTEYAAEQVFELADAIYTHNHQLVLTTNLRVDDLRIHFERADDRYGGAIVRRLTDGAKIYEMF